MRFEEALLSLMRNSQVRLTEQERSKRGRPEKDERKTSERKSNEDFLFRLSPKSSHTQAMWRPRAVAKASGIPKSLIETSGAAFGRALRARRSAQERR